MNTKKHVFIIICLTIIFLISIYARSSKIFSYQFDKNLIKRYFLSQDIPYEVSGKRLFLTDSEIHIAASYLYVKGYDPATINFQHPPFIKYLYGVSILVFNNPFYVQILLSLVLLYLTYSMGIFLFKSRVIGALASLFLIIDPVFYSQSSSALLDLGQTVFLCAFVLVRIQKKPNIWVSGILLGLASASKFWAGTAFFFLLISTYEVLSKRFNLKNSFKTIIITAITFSCVYFQSFMHNRMVFNIVFFELKTLKYWFNHSVTAMPFASLLLFITGYFKAWWGSKTWERTDTWILFYPIISYISMAGLFGIVKNKKFTTKSLIFIIPVCYLLYLGVQAPFARYFIVILPYGYLGLSYFIEKYYRLLKRHSGINTC